MTCVCVMIGNDNKSTLDDAAMTQTTNVLILCTGNSARSILAEAIFQRACNGRIRAYSAGSQPRGSPHPAAIALLADLGYDTSRFRSKSWNEFAVAGAPHMDIVLTVCDSAAGESCPFWPGSPVKAHWGIPDPAGIEGKPLEARAAFELAYRRLERRIDRFAALPFQALDSKALQEQLNQIGESERHTDGYRRRD